MRQNRKTRCQICGDVSKGVYYTATSCKSCMDFFRRCVIYKKQYKVNIDLRVWIWLGPYSKIIGKTLWPLKTKGCKNNRYQKWLSSKMTVTATPKWPLIYEIDEKGHFGEIFKWRSFWWWITFILMQNISDL